MSWKFQQSLALGVALCLVGCSTRKDEKASSRPTVVVAVEGDVDTFNPLFAEEITAGEINDLLFPGLVGSEFDRETGVLTYTPLLAKSWEEGNKGKDITFHLVTGARWSDGQPVTARDVQFSYELYGDPEVASVRQSAVAELRRTNGKLDISKSVVAVNDSTVVFYFERVYPGRLFDAGLPIIPAHVFEKIPRKDIRTHPASQSPVASGAFKLSKWTPLQEVILLPNELTKIPHPAKLEQLIARVIPDYRSRVSQLQSGEVDLVAGLRVEDATMLSAQAPSVEVVSIAGRDYDFLGWNNIDPVAFGVSEGKSIKPHPLFGNVNVRKALTLAVNREEIVNAYLGNHGEISVGGVSPLFKWAFNDTLKPLPFDQRQAQVLLEKEGWKDTDRDGVLDKQAKRFSFTLKLATGNQLRDRIAAIVQQQLRAIKIEMRIEQVERGTFWQEVTTRKYDAWLAGFSVPLQMQLEDLWGSDLEIYPFNLCGFRNKRVDQIFGATRSLAKETDGAALWKEFQVIVHEQQPCTFLFWINNIVGVNTRVRGTTIGVLGTMHNAWEWYVGEERSNMIALAR